MKGDIHSDNMSTPILDLVPSVVFAVDSRNAVKNIMGTPDMENQ